VVRNLWKDTMKYHAALATTFALLLPACSGSDDDGGGPTAASIPATFSAYCTGTLKQPVPIAEQDGPSAWVSSNATGEAPAGSSFLVEADFGKWGGYLFKSGGAVLMLDTDFSTGLVKDQDFTSDCATDATTVKTERVLLADSTFYADSKLGGAPCKLPAGTKLTNISFVSNGSVATVSTPEIEAQCSLEPSYSNDIVYGKLIPK
jgi:hypothetical protein